MSEMSQQRKLGGGLNVDIALGDHDTVVGALGTHETRMRHKRIKIAA